jgi:hypothetical protein
MSITRFQLEGLHLLGYTKRESEFLFLVATHSGYFTNRQFKSFAQTESGSVSHAFIRKLLERKHATYHAYRSGGRVYHVFARKVYQAIERENLRTRKKHELEYVKTRLGALDFVLAHPQHHYLETEAEKVGFFEREYNLGREALPVKLYRARRSAEVTPRYFVDRFPMFLNRASAPPVLTFTYVDSGAVTLDGFATHLRAYLGLFQGVRRFEFLYIAPTTRLFQAAESEFHHVLYGRREESKCVSLLEYFRVRKAWDAKERVASADVVLLKEAQGRYAGRNFEELYERWRKGSAKDSDVVRVAEQPVEAARGVFRTLVCGSSLGIFTDPLGITTENSPEADFRDSISKVSGSVPIQVSRS